MTTVYRTPLDHLGLLLPTAGSPAFSTQALSTNNTRVGWAFQAQSANAITAGGFRLTAITDGGAMPTYRISLQGLDGSGLPNGTIHASQTFTPTTGNGYANTTLTWVAFASSYTPALGEGLALVLDVSSGTASGTNNISVTFGSTSLLGSNPGPGLEYALIDTNLTWATGDKTSTGQPIFGWKTASDVFGFPVESFGTSSYTSTTEVALRFTLDAALGSTFQLLGALLRGGSMNAAQLLRLSLYSGGESSPVLLEQIELDTDWMQGSGNTGVWQRFFFDDAASTLSFGTQYHLGMSTNKASPSQGNIDFHQVNAAGDMNALPWGPNFCLASRTITYPPGSGGNVFASSATQLKQRPVFLPILSDWTVPVASSGGGQLLLHGSVVH